jgi:hypothetical protein
VYVKRVLYNIQSSPEEYFLKKILENKFNILIDNFNFVTKGGGKTHCATHCVHHSK